MRRDVVVGGDCGGGLEWDYRSMIVIRRATRPDAQAAAVMSEAIRQGRSAVFHLRSGCGDGGRVVFGFGTEKGFGSGRETEAVVVSMRWGDAAASLRDSSGLLSRGMVMATDPMRWR